MRRQDSPRKIYTKVVFDMATGETIEEDSFPYYGGVALCEGGEGGEGEPASWTESLPEDVRQWDEVKNSDAPEKFWDQMVNMRSRMGSSIRIPSSEAGEDDRAAFYKKLQEKVPGLMPTPDFDKGEHVETLYAKMGRPEKADAYALPEFKDSKGNVLEGAGKDLAESFKEVAFNAGLNQKKYEEVLSAIIKPSLQAREEAQELHMVDKAKLAEEWGAAYDRNSKVVATFIAQSDAPESLTKAIESGSIDSGTMKWLHGLATKTIGKQGSFQADDNNTNVMSPEEASMKISEIRNNKQHPYNNKFDPGNAAAKRYMRELYLLKNPKSGTNRAPGTQFNVGGVLD